MTNPLLEVVDLPRVAAFCREHGLVSVVDNTCATPVNYRPVTHGFDLVLHSATKYLNGHSDIVAGVVAGRAPLVKAARIKLNHLGGSLDPHACFLLERGLKTLALRVRHLEAHPAVARVNYPGLESHPRHARAKEWFAGCGGLLSFELRDGLPAVERFFRGVKLPADAPSLGGVETLLTCPARSSHAGLSRAEREAIGIRDGLVRIAVGLEATEDLIEDFAAALG
jgi:cystathionine beta-lyase/cystathionine gamma-synthase